MLAVESRAEAVFVGDARQGDCFMVHDCTMRLISKVWDSEGYTLRFRVIGRAPGEEHAYFEAHYTSISQLPRVLRVEEYWKL